MGFRDSRTDNSVIPRTQQPGLNPRHLLSFQTGNLQGIGKRARQEDSFAFANAFDVKAIKNKGLFFVVSDGMGGMKDGKIASDSAISLLRGDFLNMDSDGDITNQLYESTLRASREVVDKLEGEGGATLVACVIYNARLYFASVGDSFLFLKRGKHLYQLNATHNVCNFIYRDCIDNGIIDPSEGREDPESGALTSFLGMMGDITVDRTYRGIHLKPGDVIMACSDGVGGVLSKDEIWQALNLEDTPEMCTMLENGIISKGLPTQDNYTAAIVKCVL